MAVGTEASDLEPARGTAEVTVAVATPPAGRKARLRELARGLLHSGTFMVGAAILLFWIVDAIIWGLSGTLWQMHFPYDPQAIDPLNTLKGPSAAHWFGTDDLGRDMFSRVLAGASSVLTVAVTATVLGMLGGITIGLVA